MVKWLRALGQLGIVWIHLALMFFEAQIEELEKRVDGGKKIPKAADLAKRAVERFGGVSDCSMCSLRCGVFADERAEVRV